MDDSSLFVNVIVPEDSEIWEKHDHEACTNLKGREIQFRIRTKDGRSRWIDHACLPVSQSIAQQEQHVAVYRLAITGPKRVFAAVANTPKPHWF